MLDHSDFTTFPDKIDLKSDGNPVPIGNQYQVWIQRDSQTFTMSGALEVE